MSSINLLLYTVQSLTEPKSNQPFTGEEGQVIRTLGLNFGGIPAPLSQLPPALPSCLVILIHLMQLRGWASFLTWCSLKPLMKRVSLKDYLHQIGSLGTTLIKLTEVENPMLNLSSYLYKSLSKKEKRKDFGLCFFVFFFYMWTFIFVGKIIYYLPDHISFFHRKSSFF